MNKRQYKKHNKRWKEFFNNPYNRMYLFTIDNPTTWLTKEVEPDLSKLTLGEAQVQFNKCMDTILHHHRMVGDHIWTLPESSDE